MSLPRALDPETRPTGSGPCSSAQAPQAGRHHAAATCPSSAPSSPHAVWTLADTTLRQLARWLAAETDVTTVAGITRTHIEDYKVWLAAQPGTKGRTLAKNTQRQRLRMIRIFFERLIEWDWPDAPGGTRSSTGTSLPAPTRCPSS